MKPVVLLTVLLLTQFTTADLLDGLEHHHGEHHDGGEHHHEEHDNEHHEEHHAEHHDSIHDDDQVPLDPVATSPDLNIPGAATTSPELDLSADYDPVQYSSQDYFSSQSVDESPAAPGGEAKQLDSNTAPAISYPQYATVPQTSFTCGAQQYGGYFADPEAECQVFHICLNGRKMGSFLCPNGTLFHQQYFVCDWWYNVECNAAVEGYPLNANIGVVPE